MVILNVSTMMSDISSDDVVGNTELYRADLRALGRSLQRIITQKSGENCPEMVNILQFIGKLIEEVTQFEEETSRVVAELNSNKNNLGTYSLTYSLTLTYSLLLTHPLTHSLTYSLTYLLTYLLTYSLSSYQ